MAVRRGTKDCEGVRIPAPDPVSVTLRKPHGSSKISAPNTWLMIAQSFTSTKYDCA